MTDPKYIKCSVDGCEKNAHPSDGGIRGLCCPHYKRHQRYGNPLHFPQRKNKAFEWITAIVANPPDECAIWPFSATQAGYGGLKIKGKRFLAHRLALMLFTKEDHQDKLAIHGPCRNPRCCNPLHLSWGTSADNANDKFRDGTIMRGESHYRTTLTESDVKSIRSDHRKVSDIAADYGISAISVYHIRSRLSWSWLE